MDEPTTGLHLEDIRKLAAVFDRLVDAGHTLVLIEHNLDVVKLADWVIDLGPEAGDAGGEVVAMGRPEEVAAVDRSHTGVWLRTVLPDWNAPSGAKRSAHRAATTIATPAGRRHSRASEARARAQSTRAVAPGQRSGQPIDFALPRTKFPGL